MRSRYIMPQVFLQQCIDPLGLVVCLRMIGYGELQLRTQELEEFYSKAPCKPGIPITYYVLKQAKVFHHMVEKKKLAAFSTGHASSAAMNIEYFENLSTTTKMDLHSRAFRNPVMESMEIFCHGLSGMRRGCNNLAIFLFFFLCKWHTKQDFT